MIIASILFIFCGCSVGDSPILSDSSIKLKYQLTEKEKLDDFEYMYTILRENYPFFEVNKRVSGVDWLNKKDEYIDKIKSTKDHEAFYKALGSILGELHNGDHASILNSKSYFYFRDLYSQDFAWANQLNDSKAINRYIQDNNTGNTTLLADTLRNTIGYSARIVNLANQSNTNNSNLESSYVTTKILKNEDKVAYLQIKSFENINIEKDMKIIKPFLHSVKDYKKLIIDIRGNGGGADIYWRDNIVPMLIKKPLKVKYYFAYRGGAFEEDFIMNKLGFGYYGLKEIELMRKENLENAAFSRRQHILRKVI
jgi:hypothetical protein